LNFVDISINLVRIKSLAHRLCALSVLIRKSKEFHDGKSAKINSEDT